MSHIKFLFVVATLLISFGAALPARAAAGGSCIVFVGTSTDAPSKSKGIYAYRMDLTTGQFSPLGVAAETPDPTFLDLDARGHFLYAVNEVNEFMGKPTGGVSAFAIDAATGKLTLLNQRSSMGPGPCHILIDKNGKAALVANYAGGNIASLPIQPDGSLGEIASFFQYTGKGPNEKRQEAAHAHCMALDAANRFAFACDLGTDKVMIYNFDSASGKLTPNRTPFVSLKPGSGPRHLTFHPNGRYAYVLSELACTVTTFDYDSATGGLKELQTVPTLPSDFTGVNTCAEVAIDQSGKHLYASNRGHNSIALFNIDPAKGTLTFVERTPTGGETPRDFTIDPTGKFLAAANQGTGNMVIFSLDATTGKLKPTGQVLEVPAPMCVRFMPVDK